MYPIDELKENIYSVSDFLDFIHAALHPLSGVKVQGELQQVSYHPTGIYLKLKDAVGDGVLSVYCPTVLGKQLGFVLEAGMEIVVSGTPGIYKRRSELTFRALTIELAGVGALQKQYEQLKAKLHQEGLFSRKRELPQFISKIGLVTSKTGAVIQDFKKNLQELGIAVFLYDVRVEGKQSEGMILDALDYFRSQDIDILVMIRGGGSLEDMAAFNSEQVCRMLFASHVPTIVAIGHDRDEPLAQMTADAAVSTPTAAAVLVNQSWAMVEHMPEYKRQLASAFEYTLAGVTEKLAAKRRALFSVHQSLELRLQVCKSKFLLLIQSMENYSVQQLVKNAQYASRLMVQLDTLVRTHEHVVKSYSQRLHDLSPASVLSKGFALAQYNGKTLKSVRQIPEDSFTLVFQDGSTNVIKS